MLKTSHLQELKKRYASMYAPQPVEESETKEDHKIECPKCKGEGCEHCDGKGYHIEDEDADPVGKIKEGKMPRGIRLTSELLNNMKKFGVELEKYAKKSGGIDKDAFMRVATIAKKGAIPDKSDIPDDTDPRDKVLSMMAGIVGDEILLAYKGLSPSIDNYIKKTMKEEEEIDEGTALQVKMALDDVGLKGTWKNNKVYVKKKDVEKAEKALKGNVIYKGKPPEVIGEEVELGETKLEEHCGECEMGITEEVSAKEFDALKKGDTVTIEFKSSMSTGKATFKVTAKNVVGKARIEKVTLKDVKRPNSVKFFLYKRDNKVSLAQGDMAASVVSFTKEEVEIEEKKGSGYDLYHKTFSSAMQHAYAHAKKKGVIVDPKEIDDKVATGPKKPSSGKTNRYILGTNTRKKVHIQVANLDNKRYELNMYIESKIDHLGKVKNILERMKPEEVEEAPSPNQAAIDRYLKRGGKITKYAGPDKKKIEKDTDSLRTALTKMGKKEREDAKKASRRYVQGGRDWDDTDRSSMLYNLPDYDIYRDPKKFPRSLISGLQKIVSGVKIGKYEIKHKKFGRIPGLGVTFPGDSAPKLMIQLGERIRDPDIPKIAADPKYDEPGVDPKTYRKFDVVVWINEAATAKDRKIDRVDWFQRKEFEGSTAEEAAKRTLQYLKTKVKRMAKEDYNVDLEIIFEEIQRLEERRRGYSNLIPFPDKVLVDFAKRAKKAGLDFDQYTKFVKGTFKDGADEGRAIIHGRDIFKDKEDGRKKLSGAQAKKDNEARRAAQRKKLGLEQVVVEREMTPAEKAKREEIVLSLKKKTKDFKERYGDKWKEVMYATATKMAMGEEKDKKESSKKDKINLKPKMDETMKKYIDLLKGLKEKSVKEDSDKSEPGTQGDKEEYAKKRDAVLKKFGVKSCAALGTEEEKKACYKALDDAHVADHEEETKKEAVEVDGRKKGYKEAMKRIESRRSKVSEKKKYKTPVKEAVTLGGVEYGEQEFDRQHRLDQAYPNMDVNYAEFMEQGLEGPYLWKGEAYFFDRKVNGWYSVSSEDYVDDAMNAELGYAYTRDGGYKKQFAS